MRAGRELTMRAERKKEPEFGQASVLLLEQQQRELRRKVSCFICLASRPGPKRRPFKPPFCSSLLFFDFFPRTRDGVCYACCPGF